MQPTPKTPSAPASPKPLNTGAPTLEIIQPKKPAEQSALRSDVTLIGRHSSCDVVLLNGSVSRRHARVQRQGTGWHLEDLGSRAGTFLNDARIEGRAALGDGDEIRILDTTLVFRAGLSGAPLVDSYGVETIMFSCDTDGISQAGEGGTANKLRALLAITRNLGETLNVEEVLPKVLESLFEIFPQAEQGAIWLKDEHGELVPRASRGTSGGPCAPPQLSRNVAEHVLSNGRAVVCNDCATDQRFDASHSIQALGMHALLCAPLIGSGSEPHGLVQLDTTSLKRAFGEEDLDLLVNVANLAGQAIDHARLHERRLAYERRERDLAVAKAVQQQFLPSAAPVVPGYDIAHHYRAADRVGGDYMGYVPLVDGRIAMALGDVAGKGVSAALFMARLSSEVGYTLATNADLSTALGRLNGEMFKMSTDGRFVTFVLCLLDPAKHEVLIANAGHQPPLLRDLSGAVNPIGASNAGPPLGVLPDPVYRATRVQLAPSEKLLLYTDGLSEARDPQRALYGDERVKRTFATHGPASDTIARLIADVDEFGSGAPASDDQCVVCCSRDG